MSNSKINQSMIKIIKKYQTNKPIGTPTRCKHYPTCSNYGIECFTKFNFFKASFLTIIRILGCTPLNKKYFDPVPLTKLEKKHYQELDDKEYYSILPTILLQMKDTYPNMELNDYLKLIYQNTFGPKHLLDENFKESLKQDINSSTNTILKIEDIGFGYSRIYLYQDINLDGLITIFNHTVNNNIIDNNTYITFYHRINVLKRLIKEKQIKLNLSYKQVTNYIDNYLMTDLTIHHSNIYKNTYHPHYLVVKESELAKNIDLLNKKV